MDEQIKKILIANRDGETFILGMVLLIFYISYKKRSRQLESNLLNMLKKDSEDTEA